MLAHGYNDSETNTDNDEDTTIVKEPGEEYGKVDSFSVSYKYDKEKMLKEKEKCSSELEEAVKVKMVRAGQRIKKVPPKKGFKVVGNKYVRMTGAEKLARKRAVKKAVKTKNSVSKIVLINESRVLKRHPEWDYFREWNFRKMLCYR